MKISSASDVSIFESAWKMLEKGTDMTAFQTFDWNKLLLEEFFSSKSNTRFADIYLYSIQDGAKVILLAPIIVQKIGMRLLYGGRKKGIYLLGQNSYSDYLNFIYSEFSELAIEQIFTILKRDFKKSTIFIDFLRSDTCLNHYLSKIGKAPNKSSFAVYVDIMSSVEDFNKSLSKSVRQNLRTASNRMQKNNIDYKLEVFSRLQDHDLVIQLEKIYQERATEKNNKHNLDFKHFLFRKIRYLQKKQFTRTYNIITQSMLQMENSILIVVYLNNDIAGYVYGIRDNNAIRVMQNCFNSQYKFYSPMFKGVYDFISDECTNHKLSISQIDFTRGEEDYKYKLGGKKVELVHYTI